jgi:hypothetical protein
MLDSSRSRILERVPEDALVLDVGGGAVPFARADWVIDLLAYSERERFGTPADPASERFSERTWVQRDICDPEPWPFADDQFDFAVCSHTLEDVRDPVRVCAELIRVARAGYVEVPSRLEEQSYGVHGPWTGWSHHRWLADVDSGEITFVFKSHTLSGRPTARFPEGFWPKLSAEERVSGLWWEGSFRYSERIFLDGPSLDAYLDDFVAAEMARRPLVAPAPASAVSAIRSTLRAQLAKLFASKG